MQTSPQSVKFIANKVGKTRFRFRNVVSLVDFMTTEEEYCGFVMVVNLDSGQYSQMNAEQLRYALLSSKEEISYLNEIKPHAAINVAGAHYAKH